MIFFDKIIYKNIFFVFYIQAQSFKIKSLKIISREGPRDSYGTFRKISPPSQEKKLDFILWWEITARLSTFFVCFFLMWGRSPHKTLAARVKHNPLFFI